MLPEVKLYPTVEEVEWHVMTDEFHPFSAVQVPQKWLAETEPAWVFVRDVTGKYAGFHLSSSVIGGGEGSLS